MGCAVSVPKDLEGLKKLRDERRQHLEKVLANLDKGKGKK